jgi:hypothetical protein
VGVAVALGDAADGVADADAVADAGPETSGWALDGAVLSIPAKAESDGMNMTAATPAAATRRSAAETISTVRPFPGALPAGGTSEEVPG